MSYNHFVAQRKIVPVDMPENSFIVELIDKLIMGIISTGIIIIAR